MDKRRRRPRVRRSSVSLDAGDYARVCAIAAQHRPPLPVRYVIEYAVVRFLDAVRDNADVPPDMTVGMGVRRSPKTDKR